MDKEQVLALLQAGCKIEAVKHVRAVTGSSLADAKAYVEQIGKENKQ
jgi:ribosomal protein L7/L12